MNRSALLALVLSAAVACIPDIGDDETTAADSAETLPDEMVCARSVDPDICSEERPCMIDDDGYYRDCENPVEGDEPECPCSGLMNGYSAN